MTEDRTPHNPSSFPSLGVAFMPYRLTLLGFRLFSTPFRVAFQLSLTILVRYRSWNVFKVRSWYSRFCAGSNQRYSRYCLTTFQNPPTGVSPFNPPHSSGLRKIQKGRKQSKHHIYPKLPLGIRFALFRVHSPLLTESLLLSFPAVTKMFQFTAFAFLTE